MKKFDIGLATAVENIGVKELTVPAGLKVSVGDQCVIDGEINEVLGFTQNGGVIVDNIAVTIADPDEKQKAIEKLAKGFKDAKELTIEDPKKSDDKESGKKGAGKDK
jgi:hypothetical protein